jgi:hypothetical protein
MSNAGMRLTQYSDGSVSCCMIAVVPLDEILQTRLSRAMATCLASGQPALETHRPAVQSDAATRFRQILVSAGYLHDPVCIATR